MTYELTWKRQKDADLPEEELDVQSREVAVEEIVSNHGVENFEYKPPGRKLSEEPLLYFQVGILAVQTLAEVIRLYKRLSQDEQNEVVLSEDTEEALREYLESNPDEDIELPPPSEDIGIAVYNEDLLPQNVVGKDEDGLPNEESVLTRKSTEILNTSTKSTSRIKGSRTTRQRGSGLTM